MSRIRGRKALVIAIVLVVASGWILWRLFNSTIYVVYESGFSATSFGKTFDTPRPVPHDRFERLVRRLAKGDLFDYLLITSSAEEDATPVVLTREEGGVTLEVTIFRLKQAERLEAMRAAMKKHGYDPVREEPSFSGTGADSELLTVVYRVRSGPESVLAAVRSALSALEEPVGTHVFVNPFRLPDLPRGRGIRIIPNRDFLAEVP